MSVEGIELHLHIMEGPVVVVVEEKGILAIKIVQAEVMKNYSP